MSRINATIYNITTEEIVKNLKGFTEATVIRNVGEGESWAEGYYPSNEYYLKSGEFKPYPTKPNYPVTFDKTTEQWVVDTDAAWKSLRQERDYRLQTQVDPVVSNPLRWNSMTTEKQSEYETYRQQLLDLPSNTTDPTSPVWPTPPE